MKLEILKYFLFLTLSRESLTTSIFSFLTPHPCRLSIVKPPLSRVCRHEYDKLKAKGNLSFCIFHGNIHSDYAATCYNNPLLNSKAIKAAVAVINIHNRTNAKIWNKNSCYWCTKHFSSVLEQSSEFFFCVHPEYSCRDNATFRKAFLQWWEPNWFNLQRNISVLKLFCLSTSPWNARYEKIKNRRCTAHFKDCYTFYKRFFYCLHFLCFIFFVFYDIRS